MTWNFRIGTKNHKGAHPCRTFEIVECYYESDIPDSYAERDLGMWEDLEDLKGTYDKIGMAFTKPIIDLDNFPNEYEHG